MKADLPEPLSQRMQEVFWKVRRTWQYQNKEKCLRTRAFRLECSVKSNCCHLLWADSAVTDLLHLANAIKVNTELWWEARPFFVCINTYVIIYKINAFFFTPYGKALVRAQRMAGFEGLCHKLGLAEAATSAPSWGVYC